MKSSSAIFGRRTVSLAILILALLGVSLLAGVDLRAQVKDPEIPAFAGRPPNEHPILAPCSRYEERYRQLGFEDALLQDWPAMYHARVNNVIEEYLEPSSPLCSAENSTDLLPSGEELLSLATSLPTWNDPRIPLSRLDTSRVLLEYLRVYECALMEFETFLPYDTAKEEFSKEFFRIGNLPFFDFFFSDLVKESFDRSALIKSELSVARNALERTLTLLGGFERLRPLEAELECMQRLTLDVRNISALTAETSACLPRIWNARDPLRDMKELDYNAQ